MLTKEVFTVFCSPRHIYPYLLDNLVIGHLVAEHPQGVAKVRDQRRNVRWLIGVLGHSELSTQEIEKSNSCKHKRRRGRIDGHVLVTTASLVPYLVRTKVKGWQVTALSTSHFTRDAEMHEGST